MEQLLAVGPWAPSVGAVGLLFWVARLVYVGALVPRSALERAEANAATWRAAYEAERLRNHELVTQVRQFVRAVQEVTP